MLARNPIDSRLRELERRWRETGSDEAAERLYQAYRRVNDIRAVLVARQLAVGDLLVWSRGPWQWHYNAEGRHGVSTQRGSVLYYNEVLRLKRERTGRDASRPSSPPGGHERGVRLERGGAERDVLLTGVFHASGSTYMGVYPPQRRIVSVPIQTTPKYVRSAHREMADLLGWGWSGHSLYSDLPAKKQENPMETRNSPRHPLNAREVVGRRARVRFHDGRYILSLGSGNLGYTQGAELRDVVAGAHGLEGTVVSVGLTTSPPSSWRGVRCLSARFIFARTGEQLARAGRLKLLPGGIAYATGTTASTGARRRRARRNPLDPSSYPPTYSQRTIRLCEEFRARYNELERAIDRAYKTRRFAGVEELEAEAEEILERLEEIAAGHDDDRCDFDEFEADPVYEDSAAERAIEDLAGSWADRESISFGGVTDPNWLQRVRHILQSLARREVTKNELSDKQLIELVRDAYEVRAARRQKLRSSAARRYGTDERARVMRKLARIAR